MIKDLYDPLYLADVYLFYEETPEALEKWIVKNCTPKDVENFKEVDTTLLNSFNGRVRSKKNGARIWILYLGNHFKDSIAVLIHEILHLVIDILRDRGVELNGESEEAFTYYMGYWTGRILDILKFEVTRKADLQLKTKD